MTKPNDSVNSNDVLIPGLLAQRVKEQVQAYLHTTYDIRDEDYCKAFDSFISGPEGVFKGPFVDIKLPFRTSESGDLPIEVTSKFPAYAHQLKAWQRLSSRGKTPEATIVATGTGSGKTECFLFPILDHAMRHSSDSGTVAILFYPMNALASDQARRIAELITGDTRLRGKVTAGILIGEDSEAEEKRKTTKVVTADRIIDDRKEIIKNPPHILLTNYKMMDVMLQNPDFDPLWSKMLGGRDHKSLKYLVFDEMHTYDGAQGADVGLLMRRVKARLGVKQGELTCVGTSATLSSDQDGLKRLLTFAKRLFGEEFEADGVIGEDRKSVDEVFAAVTASRKQVPDDSDAMNHLLSESISQFCGRQCQLWFQANHENTAAGQLRLGQMILEHQLTQRLFKALDGKPKSEAELAQVLGMTRRQLSSFLALLSQAKRDIKSITDASKSIAVPLFHVRIQLWAREMASVVTKLAGNGPVFRWHVAHQDHLSHELYLPPVYCEECGEFGLVCSEAEPGDVNVRDLDVIAKARSNRKDSTRYLFPWTGDDVPSGGDLVHICQSCGRMELPGADSAVSATAGRCKTSECRGTTRPWLKFACVSEKKGDKPAKDLRTCPTCETKDGLRNFSGRLNTLASVISGEMFLSNLSPKSGKRLLVFAEAVQDASHRAGYLNARTYRFNMRTAMQGTLLGFMAENPSPSRNDVQLKALAKQLLSDWTERLGSKNASIAALTPSDLMVLPEYEDFWKGKPALFEAMLENRLLWECYTEFCLRSQVGRTLEKTLSSQAFVAPPNFDAHAKSAFDRLVNTHSRGEIQGIGIERFKLFIRGVLAYMLQKGAVSIPPIFEKYRKENSGWSISKKNIPWIGPLPVGRVGEGMEVGQLPNFPTTNSDHKIFSYLGVPARGESWYYNWLKKFAADGATNDRRHADDLLRHIFVELAEAGILDSVSGQAHNPNYAIKLDDVYVTLHPEAIQCTKCRDARQVAKEQLELWTDAPCRKMYCKGHYKPAPLPHGTEFYREVYSNGAVSRIFASEHTGMLGRALREEIESAFKAKDANRRADDINLLSCTSTLEMGIDIGDLSATVAAGLPRTAANFQQQVGRAGRSSGSACVVAVARTSPRDLLYFDQPFELISGHIEPPGCFLDAPDILRRQFAAYIIESRYQLLSGGQKLSVERVKNERTSSISAQGFWRTLADLIAAQGDQLIAEFKGACHLTDISDETWKKLNDDWLRTSPETGQPGFLAKLIEIFDKYSARIGTVQAQKKSAEDRLLELEKKGKLSEDEIQEQVELRRQRASAYAELEFLGADESFHGFLVKNGFLPNYAFNEDDVELVTFRRVKDENGQGDKFKTESFVRSAATAIRDFAPGNTFYGGGQKVQVDTIDLGKDSKRAVEGWRCCAVCNHLERETEAQVGKRCPKCNSSGWEDTGRKINLVKLSRVRSPLTLDGLSSGDDAEQRVQERYKTKKFFEGNSSQIWGVEDEDFPFGIEFIPRSTMRELNFGFSDQIYAEKFEIGREEFPRGFQICYTCGRAAEKDQNQIKHTATCAKGKSRPGVQNRQVGTRVTNNLDQPLALYRELTSESIRVLLPIREHQSRERIASFQAMLNLGLRKHFGGSPGHLLVERDERLSPDDLLPEYSLVLFDAVSGGSGFLKEIADVDRFLAIIEKAKIALESCGCAAENKDGCIRCVYGAVQQQRDIPFTSRNIALGFANKILGFKGQFKPITKSQLKTARWTESELEDIMSDVFDAGSGNKDLQQALERQGVTIVKGTTDLAQNKTGELKLLFNRDGIKRETTWRIELQRSFQNEDVSTRPDFWLRCVDGGGPNDLPIALYVDGFAYHASIDSKDRLQDDFEKRSALSLMGLSDPKQKTRVWSMSWDDVKAFDPKGHTFSGTVERPLLGYATHNASMTVKQGSMVYLFLLLAAGPEFFNKNDQDVVTLQKLIGHKLDMSSADFSLFNEFSHQGVSKNNIRQAFGWISEGVSVIVAGHIDGETKRKIAGISMNVSQQSREKDQFEGPWQRLLMTANLLGIVADGVGVKIVD